MIRAQDIEEIVQRTSLAVVAGSYTDLRSSGTRLVGLCPLHTERTPSFTVDAEKGLFYCFGCSVGGDAITLVMKAEQLSFTHAVRWLARKSGVVIGAARPRTCSGADAACRSRPRAASFSPDRRRRAQNIEPRHRPTVAKGHRYARTTAFAARLCTWEREQFQRWACERDELRGDADWFAQLIRVARDFPDANGMAKEGGAAARDLAGVYGRVGMLEERLRLLSEGTEEERLDLWMALRQQETDRWSG